ncbi:MAG: hypothetical protein JW745_02620 [Sedimentisphaerales bacterium]|nr:hypothetical protein [Sedimentisphaerales bacterium]MBN2844186.1 hypothetical protein [Sedimentisphaerales bacterium]
MRKQLCLLILSCINLFCYSQENAEPYYTSMDKTIMCGYQGWFTCPGDGTDLGWSHWGTDSKTFQPGSCTIDLWPDMSEYPPAECYPTDFRYPDGSQASVFSSANEKTIIRHFSWMADYGIDGIFLQRFITETTPRSAHLNWRDSVLKHCRKGANQYQRSWAVMYDLSGLGENQIDRVRNDWKHLVNDLNVIKDKSDRSYLYHKGKPVVALWGIGFNDGRKYTLAQCGELIDYFKNDPNYGGCTVMIGIPSYWREGGRDCVTDQQRLEVFAKADILSPWSVGRYGSENNSELDNYCKNVWTRDMQWCQENNLDYLPVIFPGFSWHNLQQGKSKLNQIPRLSGNFFQRQADLAINQARSKMLYVAMFDEVDEGTAIFKCTNQPPTGNSPFCTYEGLPSDHYLRLTGQIGKMLRGEIPVQSQSNLK